MLFIARVRGVWQDFCIGSQKPHTVINAKVQQDRLKETIEILRSHPWKLVSIYETGLVPDFARYNGEVEIVFGKLNLYAIYANKSEVFPYRFIGPKIFKVRIADDDAVCRIQTLSSDKVVFHADYKDSHFIVELHKKD